MSLSSRSDCMDSSASHSHRRICRHICRSHSVNGPNSGRYVSSAVVGLAHLRCQLQSRPTRHLAANSLHSELGLEWNAAVNYVRTNNAIWHTKEAFTLDSLQQRNAKQDKLRSATYVRWQRGSARIRTPLLQQSIDISCQQSSPQQTCNSGFAAVSPCWDTYGEMTSQNLWSRYYRHFMGINLA